MLYGEDIYVGYRYYEKTGVKPLFSFCHGLSYTSFSLSNMTIFQKAGGRGNITDETLEMTVFVENNGSRSGSETAQVYISPSPSSRVMRPIRELKGFKKVKLEPGEKREVTVSIPLSLATSYWDENRSAWLSEAGEYTATVVGTGMANTVSQTFTLGRTRWWNGLPHPAVNDDSTSVDGTGAHVNGNGSLSYNGNGQHC